jgi:hypothetical protein
MSENHLMNKEIYVAFFMLVCVKCLPGQDLKIDQPSAPKATGKLSLVTGAGITTGIRLDEGESLLFADSTVLLLALNGEVDRMIANYEFDPQNQYSARVFSRTLNRQLG